MALPASARRCHARTRPRRCREGGHPWHRGLLQTSQRCPPCGSAFDGWGRSSQLTMRRDLRRRCRRNRPTHRRHRHRYHRYHRYHQCHRVTPPCAPSIRDVTTRRKRAPCCRLVTTPPRRTSPARQPHPPSVDALLQLARPRSCAGVGCLQPPASTSHATPQPPPRRRCRCEGILVVAATQRPEPNGACGYQQRQVHPTCRHFVQATSPCADVRDRPRLRGWARHPRCQHGAYGTRWRHLG